MNEYDVKRLAKVLAIQAQIEAMKVENEVRKINGRSPAFIFEQFMARSDELIDLGTCHNEQL